jgi:hypothetical protein
MKASQKGRITRISRIKGTDYTEHGGGIVRPEILSAPLETILGRAVPIASCPCNPCP